MAGIAGRQAGRRAGGQAGLMKALETARLLSPHPPSLRVEGSASPAGAMAHSRPVKRPFLLATAVAFFGPTLAE